MERVPFAADWHCQVLAATLTVMVRVSAELTFLVKSIL